MDEITIFVNIYLFPKNNASRRRRFVYQLGKVLSIFGL